MTLRERIEGLSAKWNELADSADCCAKEAKRLGYLPWDIEKHAQVAHILNKCIAELAAALVAEGREVAPLGTNQFIVTTSIAEDGHTKRYFNSQGKQIFVSDTSYAAAPSLHKEEPDFGTEVIAGLDAINKHNAALHKEGAVGEALRELVRDLRDAKCEGPSQTTGPVLQALRHVADRIEAALAAGPSLHAEAAKVVPETGANQISTNVALPLPSPAREILHSLRMKLGAESMIQHRVNDYIIEHLDRLESALEAAPSLHKESVPPLTAQVAKEITEEFCGGSKAVEQIILARLLALTTPSDYICTRCQREIPENVPCPYCTALHKEGAGGDGEPERIARQWLINGGGGHEDGEDGLRALSVTGEGLVEFLAAYGDYISVSLTRAFQRAASLPLQRTLPDEQFKGAVVEALREEFSKECERFHAEGHKCVTCGREDLEAVRREALEEAARVLDKFTNPLVVSEKLTWITQPMTFCRVMETLAAEIRALAASPAGRAIK